MSAILTTIDYLKSFRIEDYFQYNEDKFGYVIEMIDNDKVLIREASETRRVELDEVFKNTIRVVPLAGSKPSVDRNIQQPPSPPEDKKRLIIKDRSDESQELIDVMKLGIKWVDTRQTKSHPFYEYLKDNNNNTKGWIRKKLPDNIDNSEKEMTSDMSSIFINQFTLFSGFPMTHGQLKDWQQYLYHAWGISRWTSNCTLKQYYERGFHYGRLSRVDKGFTLMNSPKKGSQL